MSTRLRVTADIVLPEGAPPEMHQQIIARNAGTLVNTAALAEIDGVDADLRVERVVYVHVHDGENNRCRGCYGMSQDGLS